MKKIKWERRVQHATEIVSGERKLCINIAGDSPWLVLAIDVGEAEDAVSALENNAFQIVSRHRSPETAKKSAERFARAWLRARARALMPRSVVLEVPDPETGELPPVDAPRAADDEFSFN